MRLPLSWLPIVPHAWQEIAMVNKMTLLEIIRRNTKLRVPTATQSFFSPSYCQAASTTRCVPTSPPSPPNNSPNEQPLGSGVADALPVGNSQASSCMQEEISSTSALRLALLNQNAGENLSNY